MSYCEWPEFYSETYQRAQKKHSCVECAAPILPGERYLRYNGKWGGRVSGGCQHLLCRAACIWIRDEFQEGDCLGFGQLKEYYMEFSSWTRTQKRVKVLRKMLARILWRERQYFLSTSSKSSIISE
jgi:hypothetical protein